MNILTLNVFEVNIKYYLRIYERNFMGIKIVIPEGTVGGFYRKYKWGVIGLWAHSLQSDQRWIFLIRIGKKRLGYRTRGDSRPGFMSWYNGGFHFPWQKRTVSGRG